MSTQANSEAETDKKLKIITAVGIVIAIFLFFVFIFGGPKAQEAVDQACATEAQELVD